MSDTNSESIHYPNDSIRQAIYSGGYVTGGTIVTKDNSYEEFKKAWVNPINDRATLTNIYPNHARRIVEEKRALAEVAQRQNQDIFGLLIASVVSLGLTLPSLEVDLTAEDMVVMLQREVESLRQQKARAVEQLQDALRKANARADQANSLVQALSPHDADVHNTTMDDVLHNGDLSLAAVAVPLGEPEADGLATTVDHVALPGDSALLKLAAEDVLRDLTAGSSLDKFLSIDALNSLPRDARGFVHAADGSCCDDGAALAAAKIPTIEAPDDEVGFASGHDEQER